MMRGENPDTRHLVKNNIPENSIGAEIGVWKAESSMQFLTKAKHLHMVDPWSLNVYKKDDTGWVNRSFEEVLEFNSIMTGSNTEEGTQEYYEKVYREVCDKVKDYPATIYRETSDEWFAHFDEQIDWIYIDGDHTYEGCYSDLENALKITTDIIFCDDYMVAQHEGVRFAIDDFCLKYNLTPVQLYQNQCMIKL